MVFSLEKYHFKTGSLFEGLSIKEYKVLKANMIKLEVKARLKYSNGKYSAWEKEDAPSPRKN